jgi:5'(3')-deoxyribonucleotidase
MSKIYLDIDDVLVNCSDGICKFVQRENPYKDQKNWGEREIHVLLDIDWRDMWVNAPWQIWANFEKMPWADKLVEIAIDLVGPDNVYLLTAPVKSEGCCYGKQVWAENTYPNIPLIIAKEKQACVDNDSVLIDDSIKNKERFFEDKKENNFILFPSYGNMLAGLVDTFTQNLNLMEAYIRTNYEVCKSARAFDNRKLG